MVNIYANVSSSTINEYRFLESFISCYYIMLSELHKFINAHTHTHTHTNTNTQAQTQTYLSFYLERIPISMNSWRTLINYGLTAYEY